MAVLRSCLRVPTLQAGQETAFSPIGVHWQWAALTLLVVSAVPGSLGSLSGVPRLGSKPRTHPTSGSQGCSLLEPCLLPLSSEMKLHTGKIHSRRSTSATSQLLMLCWVGGGGQTFAAASRGLGHTSWMGLLQSLLPLLGSRHSSGSETPWDS